MELVPRSVPLRRRLLLLAAAAILPTVVMSAVGLAVVFKQQREQGERAALETTRAFATAIDAEIQRSVSILEVLARSSRLDRGDWPSFEERLRSTAATQRGWRTLILAEADGRQLVNTRYESGKVLPQTVEHDSFKAALERRRPVVGSVSKGPEGEWAIPLRVPIIRDNQPTYVLTAVLRPEAILEVLSRQRLPEGWVVTVADSRGLRIARSMGHAQSVGTPVSGTLRDMIQAGVSTGFGTTTEGRRVYSALATIADHGWLVATGIPQWEVEAAGWGSLAALGGGILLSIFAGLVAAQLVAVSINRPMVELRGAAQAVGRGDDPQETRTDIREIEEVSQALLASAEQRKASEAEREQLLRREQAARALAEAANRAKDEFLAMLGHELRNPLAAVSNAASLLRMEKLPAAPREQAVTIINRQVGHLARLTDDLLDASRALTGKIVLRREPLNVAALASHTLATLKSSGKIGRHKVFFDEASEAWAEIDPIRFDQVMTNLLVNATKYTAEGGHIGVSVAREGKDAVVRVSDDGIGFTPELAARAFDLFVQGERDLDRAQGGLGIGLTLVRRLTELHGGGASLHSDGPGKGSVFTIRIPAIEKPAQPAGALPARSRDARHILLVEDNEDARESLRSLLEIAGHRVDVASDGEQGLRMAIEHKPEVAILDIGLPKLNGYQVASRLRAMGPPGPLLIALTGYGVPEDRERALAEGFDVHVVKPVDVRLLEELMSMLPERAAEQAGAAA